MLSVTHTASIARAWADEHIVRANRRPFPLKSRSNSCVVAISVSFKGQDCHRSEYRFYLPRQPLRSTFRSTVAQLTSDNDAREHIGLPYFGDAGCDRALRLTHQVREDVGVEQV